MRKVKEYVHRDISWLSFNYRVLQEAKDPSVPLMERIKFLAIYSSNLDEFFRVRVANHRNLVRLGKKTKSRLYEDPMTILKKIVNIVNEQQREFTYIFEVEIIPELEDNDIFIKSHAELDEEQLEYVESYFHDNLMPFVQPVLLVKNKIKPFINNASLYLFIVLNDKSAENPDDQYALVNIPSDRYPRFIILPAYQSRKDIIILDDVVRHNITQLFPGYEIINSYSIKLTRDAELYIDDEYTGDLLQKIRRSLAKRNVGPASRLVYDREMSDTMLEFLMEAFDLKDIDLLEEGRYHNNFDFFHFPDFGLEYLNNPPLPPLKFLPLEDADNYWELIEKKDQLIHMPYHSYEAVIRFFELAAEDPDVSHIKVTQYRVAKQSRIMMALIKASRAGKQVSVFIEIKARFDEEANLKWGERLEREGINVEYSFPGLKVHSKLALIRRVHNNIAKMYAYISTGNFHEETAKLYSDLGLFTAHDKIVQEVARLFSFLETDKEPQVAFDELLVGQFQLRDDLKDLISNEIKQANKGKEAKIILKLNSLQDQEMISLLYDASEAGVQINLIVRGICCLNPGVEDLSENITGISIVDRFLEHSRIYYFYHDGEEKLYLSSADWMVRNLSYRIEAAVPVYDQEIRNELMEYLNMQLSDNIKARYLSIENLNDFKREEADIAIRSQVETYYYYKRKLENYYNLLTEEDV